jgi:hypothetical protein
MNKDFRVDVGLFTHPKDPRLKRLLGRKGEQRAFEILGLLWGYTATHFPKGVLEGVTEEELAKVLSPLRRNTRVVQILFEVGFLDAEPGEQGTPSGHLQDAFGTLKGALNVPLAFSQGNISGPLIFSVHDWLDWNGWAAYAPERSRKARKAAASRWGVKIVDGQDSQEYPNGGPCSEHRPSMIPNHAPSPSPSPIPKPIDLKASIDGRPLGAAVSATNPKPKREGDELRELLRELQGGKIADIEFVKRYRKTCPETPKGYKSYLDMNRDELGEFIARDAELSRGKGR